MLAREYYFRSIVSISILSTFSFNYLHRDFLKLVRPKIHVPNQLVPAYQGTDVELECRVEAFPKPEAIWLFGEGLNVRDMLAQYEKHAREVEHLNSLGEADLSEDRPKLLVGPSYGPNWQKYSFEEIQEGYRMTMRLTIRRLELYDYGSYKCVARNNLGEKEGVVRLYREFSINSRDYY